MTGGIDQGPAQGPRSEGDVHLYRLAPELFPELRLKNWNLAGVRLQRGSAHNGPVHHKKKVRMRNDN